MEELKNPMLQVEGGGVLTGFGESQTAGTAGRDIS